MNRGTVVPTPFPFSDLTGRKVRPAVVVSRSDRAGDDAILVFLSSQVRQQLLPTDVLIPADHPDFAMTGLKGPAIMKCDKVATIAVRLILGELGELSVSFCKEMDDRLRYALEL